MTVSVAKVARIKNQPQRFGQMSATILDVTLDSSYASGGEAITLSQLGFGVACYGIVVIGWQSGASGSTATSVTDVKPDIGTETAPKLVCFTGAGVEASGDLSAITVRILAFGL